MRLEQEKQRKEQEMRRRLNEAKQAEEARRQEELKKQQLITKDQILVQQQQMLVSSALPPPISLAKSTVPSSIGQSSNRAVVQHVSSEQSNPVKTSGGDVKQRVLAMQQLIKEQTSDVKPTSASKIVEIKIEIKCRVVLLKLIADVNPIILSFLAIICFG